MTTYLPRLLDSELDTYLDTFGAVLIKGPKWCGKTTTALQRAHSTIKLQDPQRSREYMKMADIAPHLLLKGEYPRLIDEWQMVPLLWDAVRSTVDEEQKAGMFILTGSAVPRDEDTLHSGTGRIARLLMRPMSLYESQDSSGAISLQSLFDGTADVEGTRSNLTIEHLAYTIARGGWPASLGKTDEQSLLIAREYIASLAESDVSRVDGISRNPGRVTAILRAYARNISTLASNTTILQDVQAQDTTLSESSFYSYVTALNRLYVFEDIPAWSPALRSKTAIRSTPKKGFIDPSLAVGALGIGYQELLQEPTTFGFLFEALCIRDLRIYSQAHGGVVSYYHDRQGLECDCVVHLRDGRYALIEVKLGSREIDEGAEHLVKLKSLIEEKKMKSPSFLMVLTGGAVAYTRADGVKVVPVGCLRD